MKAWKDFKTGKNKKQDIIDFEMHLEYHIFTLHDNLIRGKYKHDPYIDFYVCDPKRRHIHKASVRDRVLHQAVFSALYPIFDKHFIYHSYSSRTDKGTHSGVLNLQKIIRKETNNWKHNVYVLKCDIRKFFDSIDRTILMSMLQKPITDKNTLKLLENIVMSFRPPSRNLGLGNIIPWIPDQVRYDRTTGIPLGNVTSQLFANVYLNELDQYIKHTLKQKHYLRYCDDFVIIHHDKSVLEKLIVQIQNFLSEQLKLELHPHKIEIRKTNQGIDFLGYIILPHIIIIRTKTRKRIIKKVGKVYHNYLQGIISKDQFTSIIQSYKGVVAHASDRELRRYLDRLEK